MPYLYHNPKSVSLNDSVSMFFINMIVDLLYHKKFTFLSNRLYVHLQQWIHWGAL